MSLHAQLHPEALEALKKQQRQTRATSIAIGALSLLLIGLLLALFGIPGLTIPAKSPEYRSVKSEIDQPDTPPITRTSPLKKPAPPSRANPVIAALMTSNLSIPRPELVLPTETDAFGSNNGDDFGDGTLGDGDGSDGDPDQYISIPPTQRCSKPERLARLKATGGSPEVDDAVIKTLRWLKNTQNKDGSWGQQHKVGMTGFALLAYLGHCETPVSLEFGDSCTQGLVYLLDVAARNKGKLATNLNDNHWPYEHAIATYALAEALSFSRMHGYRIPTHDDTVHQAGQWIIDNQHQSGGWDYAYSEDSPRGGDLSVAGWHLQALKACNLTGLDFRNLSSCIRNGLAYVEARQASNGGFGYSGTTPVGGSLHSLTGVGVLSLQIWNKASSQAASKGVRYIVKNTPFDYSGPHADLYAHYYHSQALLRTGGSAWEDYNATFSSQLLGAQEADGGFGVPGGGAKIEASATLYAQNNPEGKHYRNCLCALMLEVYYRYLPGTSH